MHVRSLAAAFLALALSLPAEAGAMAAGVLIGQPLKRTGGERIGAIADIEFPRN